MEDFSHAGGGALHRLTRARNSHKWHEKILTEIDILWQGRIPTGVLDRGGDAEAECSH